MKSTENCCFFIHYLKGISPHCKKVTEISNRTKLGAKIPFRAIMELGSGEKLDIRRKTVDVVKLVGLLTILHISTIVSAQETKAYGFEDLVFKRCNNSCTLTPKTGTPFKVEYRVVNRETEESGTL